MYELERTFVYIMKSLIYTLTWDECRETVQGKGKKAKHESFTDRADAEEFKA